MKNNTFNHTINIGDSITYEKTSTVDNIQMVITLKDGTELIKPYVPVSVQTQQTEINTAWKIPTVAVLLDINKTIPIVNIKSEDDKPTYWFWCNDISAHNPNSEVELAVHFKLNKINVEYKDQAIVELLVYRIVDSGYEIYLIPHSILDKSYSKLVEKLNNLNSIEEIPF